MSGVKDIVISATGRVRGVEGTEKSATSDRVALCDLKSSAVHWEGCVIGVNGTSSMAVWIGADLGTED